MPVRRPLSSLAAFLVLGAASGCSSGAAELTAEAPSSTPSGTSQPSESPTPSPSSSPTESPPQEPPVAPPPPDGACRVLTRKDISPPTNVDPRLPCKRPHTAETIYVGTWPRKVVEKVDNVDDPALFRVVFSRCATAYKRTVGGDLAERDTSLLSWAWFKPSRRDFAAGANWFRCDLYVADLTAQRLLPLPRRVEGVLNGSVPNLLRACWTRKFSDEPRAKEGRAVSCSRPHVQRAIGVTRVGRERERYPGTATVRQRSSDRCRDQAGAYLGYPSSWSWGYTWPDRDQWAAGDRHTTCWAVTPR